MEEIKTKHILVSGRVQGVYFRTSCVDIARKLGITGWVRNLPDGRVEIMASGGFGIIDDFLKWCAQGPSGARVENLSFEDKPAQTFENFTILRV
jgi:acylphosphatase